jgi:hypothetical protein
MSILSRIFPRDVRLPPRMVLAASLRQSAKEAAALGYDFHAYRLHAVADAAECLLCGDKPGAFFALGWAAHYRAAAPSPQMGRLA